MSKVRFKKAPDDQEIPNAGEWCYVTIHSIPERREAAIGCPLCGCHARLGHEIDDKGVVTPSLVCPHTPCTFHDWGILEDWDPNPVISGTIDIEDEDTEETVPCRAYVPKGQDADDPDFKP